MLLMVDVDDDSCSSIYFNSTHFKQLSFCSQQLLAVHQLALVIALSVMDLWTKSALSQQLSDRTSNSYACTSCSFGQSEPPPSRSIRLLSIHCRTCGFVAELEFYP